MRSKNKESLLEIINNKELEEASRQSAIEQMVKMTDTAEKEEAAEMLLEAKGFSNVVVSITDDSADVVLDMGKEQPMQNGHRWKILLREKPVYLHRILLSLR